MKYKKILAGVLTAAMVLTGIPASGLALQAQAEESTADYEAILYSNVPTYTKTYTATANYTAENGLPAYASPTVASDTEGVSAAFTGRRLLQNHTSNENNSLDAFDTATDSSLDFSKAEFVVTSTGTTNQYTAYNEASGLYFLNNGTGNWFSTSSQTVYITPVSDGSGTFTVSTSESGNYTIFYLTQMNFNRMSGTSTGTNYVYNLTLLEKQDSASENDILPGYKAVSEITSGNTYLIAHIYESGGDSRVIVVYAQQANMNGCTKLLSTNIEQTLTITADPTVLTADTTATVTADGSTYAVQYHTAAQHFYKEKDFWDVQVTEGKLADQTEDDAWHYQVQGADNKWTDLPSDAYYSNSLSDDDYTTAAWMNDNNTQHNTYHWAKLSRSQITSTLSEDSGLQGVAYAYQVPEDGYYLATLEENVTNCGTTKLAISVTHAASDMTAADGRTLLSETQVGQGETFTSKIAKAKAGDYIRISASRLNAWATGFFPMIVPCTASQYAAQYAAEIQAFVDAGAYTEATKSRVTEKLNALTSLIAENASATESEIETAIADLELAATGAGRTDVNSTTAGDVADGGLELRYDNPTVGSSLTIDSEAEMLFASANSLTVHMLFQVDSSVTTTLPLVTASDGQGGYLTFLLNPQSGVATLASGTAGAGCPSSFNFSRAEGWKVNDGAWHELVMSVSKDGFFYVSMDGGTGAGTGVGNPALSFNTYAWSNQAMWNPIASLLTDHDWEVSELLLGLTATSGDYSNSSNYSTTNGVGSTAALTEESGLTVRYLDISSKYYTSSGDTNNAPDFLADYSVTNTFVAELGALIQTAEALNQNDYTTESWNTFSADLANARNQVSEDEDNAFAVLTGARDYSIRNAIDALQTAITSLEAGYFTGTKVTLGGKIGLNFFTDKTADDNVTVKFTKKDGTETTVEATDDTTTNPDGSTTNVRYYTFELPAKEMADTVTATMYDSDGNEISRTDWSVKAYAEKALAVGDYAGGESYLTTDAEKSLVKAMLNYGAAAQKNFEYNLNSLANSNLDAEDQNLTAIGADELTEVCNGQGLSDLTDYVGMSLVLKSETAIKLYFNTNSNATVTITDAEGNVVSAETGTSSNGTWYKIPDIAADKLGNAYTVEVGGTSGSVSALKYCDLASGTEDENLKALAGALYRYYLAANTYKNSTVSTGE